MAGEFELEVATPERMLLKERVSEARVPGAKGELGILPGHAPLVSALGEGTLQYKPSLGGVVRAMAISGGLVEVLPDHVRVLADRAEFGDEVDVKRAQQALERANERLTKAPEGLDVARALNAARRAQARLAAAKFLSK